MKTRFPCLAGAMALAACMFSMAVTAPAAPIVFQIDSSASTLTLSGAAFGLPIGQQSPGSLVDHWGGTIVADLTGGVLTFAGGSAITAALNPAAPFSTFPNPGTGGVDNYGGFASGLVTGVGLVLQLNASYRSLTLDITGGTATDGAAASGMNLAFTDGHLDWGAIVSPTTPYGGTSSMVEVAGANTSAGLVSFDGTTLTLPITLHTTGSNRYEDWVGSLVAVVVPEPSSLALALVGFGLLAANARARARRP